MCCRLLGAKGNLQAGALNQWRHPLHIARNIRVKPAMLVKIGSGMTWYELRQELNALLQKSEMICQYFYSVWTLEWEQPKNQLSDNQQK